MLARLAIAKFNPYFRHSTEMFDWDSIEYRFGIRITIVLVFDAKLLYVARQLSAFAKSIIV